MGLKRLKTSTSHRKHYQFTIISINGSGQFQFYRFGALNGRLTLTTMLRYRDNRQFTRLFGIGVSGKFAGRLQLIGNTLPKQGVMDFFKEDVFHDVSESHWCVGDIIKNDVTKLYQDYIWPQSEELSCCRTQKRILLWDVYYVHRGDSILEWVANTFTNVYVPASCTSMLHPLDVAVNGVFKRPITSFFAAWLAMEAKKQFDNGAAASVLKVDVRLTTLREPFILWVVSDH